MVLSLRNERWRRFVALAAVLALVIGLVGAVSFVIGADGDDPVPTVDASPTLDLVRTSTLGAATGATGPFVLDALLPTTDEQGVVVSPRTSTASEAQVRRLLDALGLDDAEPVDVAGGWTAEGTVDGEQAAFALDETAGNVWQYARGPEATCLAVQPGGVPDDSVASCPAASASAYEVPGPGRAAVLREAKDLFAVVGVTPGSGLRANDDGAGSTFLDVPLEVEGLPVVDVTLSVGVDADGIAGASGWLDPALTTVGRYDLRGADAAFVELQDAPRPDIACDPTDPKCSDDPQKVTNARLAWLTTRDADGVVLVPAWQFEVDGFYGPAAMALDPRYVRTGG